MNEPKDRIPRHVLNFAMMEMLLSRAYPSGIEDRWFDGMRCHSSLALSAK